MDFFIRSFIIFSVIKRYALLDLLSAIEKPKSINLLLKFYPQSKQYQHESTPARLRMALEELGPIFVKFGQVLSTRPDIFPPEYIMELSKLQDKVPAFDDKLAFEQIEKDFNQNLSDLFYSFDTIPVASASISQVYRANLKDESGNKGADVAVKVLRPNVDKMIKKDLNVLSKVCHFFELVSNDAKRLRLNDVLKEFEKYLHDEINLLNEAANASLLGRQFSNSSILRVPQVYFDFCTKNVLTLEWMDGIPVSEIDTLKANNIDLQQLSEYGVKIFFTQVFNNGFFHADMHPGNIFVSYDNRYIALDFGIVGTLTEYDKRYLAINFLAFLNRDYYRVAEAHIESGWAPPNTRIDELESAIRYVCEPIFNQPLARISFGLVLIRLFEVSRRFDISVQPQLVLLQKTLLNVEGLGRQLNPDLDIWQIGKPFFNNWASEQFGLEALWKNIKKESMVWSRIIPEMPRRLYNSLQQDHLATEQSLEKMVQIQKSTRNWMMLLSALMSLIILVLIIHYLIYQN